MPSKTLRQLLGSGDVVYCAFCLLPQPMGAEMIAAQDWDCVLIDCQHGLIDYADMLAMLVAVQGQGKPAIVRPPLNDEGFIGKALDAGADGIMCPMINSADDARWLADAANYPPVGSRSWGPVRAQARFGLDSRAFHSAGNDLTEIWAMVETRESLDTIDHLFTTPGIDGVFIGPNDLSNSLTGGAHVDPGHPLVKEALTLVLEKSAQHNSFAGIYANTVELARCFVEQGFRFIAMGSDAGFLKAGSAEMLRAVKG